MAKLNGDYDYDELFPGRFLKAGEFKGRDVTLRIAGINIEEMPDKKGTKKNKEGVLVKVKPYVSFTTPKGRPVEKAVVLNRTNGECLKGMFGRRTKDWIGRLVTLCPRMVEAFGSETLAIRVRGSPELDRDLKIEVKAGQTTRYVTMKRTSLDVATKPGQTAAPAEPEREELEPAAPESVTNLDSEAEDDFETGLLDEVPPDGESEPLTGADGSRL